MAHDAGFSRRGARLEKLARARLLEARPRCWEAWLQARSCPYVREWQLARTALMYAVLLGSCYPQPVPSYPWDDIETFLAVAEQGSFSAAARQLSVGQPTVSRRIASFEEALGNALFTRGIGGTSLTEAGRRLLPAAKQMARWAGELHRQAEGGAGRVSGVVRVAAPPCIAFEVLTPWAGRLREAFPELQLELLAGAESADLARGEADLAVRARAPIQPELASLGRIELRHAVVASMGYCARCGAPSSPADLDWITWAPPLTHMAPRPQLEKLIADFQPRFASNSFLVQLRALREGLGAMILPVAARMDDGPWVRMPGLDGLGSVALELELPSGAYYLVLAKSSRLIPRVASVGEHLVRYLRTHLSTYAPVQGSD